MERLIIKAGHKASAALKAGKDTPENIWSDRALQHLKHLYSGVPGYLTFYIIVVN